MEKINIGFSRPKTWKPFAALIMWIYQTPYDHVYIRIPSEKYNRDIIYQASGLTINFTSPNVFVEKNVIVKEFEINITDDQLTSLMQFSIDNAGKPYSLKEALGLGLVRVLEIFGKKIKNPFRGGTSNYVCSILADYILDNFTDMKSPEDFEDMSPLDVWNFLEKINSK